MEQSGITSEKRFLGWGKYEFGLVVWFFFAWGFIFLDRLTISFLAPAVMGDLGITTVQYGLIGTATTGCFAVSSIVFGAISDNSGVRKKWLIPFVLATAVFSALGAVTNSFATLIIDRALVGFCEGPIISLMMAMVAKESTPNRLALNAGIINTGVAVIAVAFGPVFVTQVAAAHDWRMAFLLASIPAFLLGLLMMKFVREVRFQPNMDASGKKESAFSSLGKMLKYKNVVICFLVGILTMIGYWNMMLYASLFFSTVGGRELTSVGVILGMMGVLGIVWTIAVPKLSDAIGRKPALIIWFAIAALAPFIMFGVPTSFAAVVIYCLVAGIPGSIFPLCYSVIPAETLPPSLIGTAGGLIIGVAEIVGGSAWPAISGVVATNSGLPTVLFVGGVCYLIALVLCIFLKETHGKEKRLAIKEAKNNVKQPA